MIHLAALSQRLTFSPEGRPPLIRRALLRAWRQNADKTRAEMKGRERSERQLTTQLTWKKNERERQENLKPVWPHSKTVKVKPLPLTEGSNTSLTATSNFRRKKIHVWHI